MIARLIMAIIGLVLIVLLIFTMTNNASPTAPSDLSRTATPSTTSTSLTTLTPSAASFPAPVPPSFPTTSSSPTSSATPFPSHAFMPIMLLPPMEPTTPMSDSPPSLTPIFEAKIPSENQKVVCITFDDGHLSQMKAIPILKQYNFTATFAIINKYADYDHGSNYMNWSIIQSLYAQGFDIESHSYSHQNLNSLTQLELEQEIVYSKQDFKEHGIDVSIFIYPYGLGYTNNTVRQQISQNYICARTIIPPNIDMSNISDIYALPAYGVLNTTTVQTFASHLKTIRGNIVTILYYHTIGDGKFSLSITEEQFRTQMKYLSDNGFTVMNMKQLFEANR